MTRLSAACGLFCLLACARVGLATRADAQPAGEEDNLDLDGFSPGRSLLTLTAFNGKDICTNVAVPGLFVLGTSSAKTGPKVTWAAAATACKAAGGTLTTVTANNRKRVYALLKTCLGLGKSTSKKLATVQAWVDVVSGFKNTKTAKCTSFYADAPTKGKMAAGEAEHSPCAEKLAAVCTYTPGKACGKKDGDVCDPKCANACNQENSGTYACLPDKASFTGHRCAICGAYPQEKCNPVDDKLCKAAGLGGTCNTDKTNFGKFPPYCVPNYGHKKGPKAPTCAFCGTKARQGCSADEDAANCPAGLCGGNKDLHCINDPKAAVDYCIATSERCPSKAGAQCFYDDVRGPRTFVPQAPTCPSGGGGCTGLNLRCVVDNPNTPFVTFSCRAAPCPTTEGDVCWPLKPTCANKNPCGTTGLHCSFDPASVSRYSCTSKTCGAKDRDECDPACPYACGFNPSNQAQYNIPLSCVPDNSSSTGNRCAYCNVIPSTANPDADSYCNSADDAICQAGGADGTCAAAAYTINSTAGGGAVAPACQTRYGASHKTTQCGFCGSKAGDPCDSVSCSAVCGGDADLHCRAQAAKSVGDTGTCITTADLCPTAAGAPCWTTFSSLDMSDTNACPGKLACGAANLRCVGNGPAAAASISGRVCVNATCPTKKYDACYPGASSCPGQTECGATGFSCLYDSGSISHYSCQDPSVQCGFFEGEACDPSCPASLACGGYGANGVNDTTRAYCSKDSTSATGYSCAHCDNGPFNSCTPSDNSRCKAAGAAGTCNSKATPGLACLTVDAGAGDYRCNLCASKAGQACLAVTDPAGANLCPGGTPCGSSALYCDRAGPDVLTGTCKAVAICGAKAGDICSTTTCPQPKTCGGNNKLACELATPLAKNTTCVVYAP